MTRDDIVFLLRRTGGHPKDAFSARLHPVLDRIDRQIGIRTRHGCATAYQIGAKHWSTNEYIGARIRRIEAHLRASKAVPYFHLGAAAEGRANAGAEEIRA